MQIYLKTTGNGFRQCRAKPPHTVVTCESVSARSGAAEQLRLSATENGNRNDHEIDKALHRQAAAPLWCARKVNSLFPRLLTEVASHPGDC